MKLKKLLQLGAAFVFVLAHKALVEAKKRAALFCEDGLAVQHKERNDDSLYPCYPLYGMTKRCSLNDYIKKSGGFGAYDGPFDFDWFYAYFIQCDGSERAGICEYSGGTWRRVKQCSQDGYEAVVTILRDHPTRRRLGGKGKGKGNKDKPIVEEVEIDGDLWDIIKEPEDPQD